MIKIPKYSSYDPVVVNEYQKNIIFLSGLCHIENFNTMPRTDLGQSRAQQLMLLFNFITRLYPSLNRVEHNHVFSALGPDLFLDAYLSDFNILSWSSYRAIRSALNNKYRIISLCDKSEIYETFDYTPILE